MTSPESPTPLDVGEREDVKRRAERVSRLDPDATVAVRGSVLLSLVAQAEDAARLSLDYGKLLAESNNYERERDALREVDAAQTALLVCYRTGNHRRADAALTRLDKARAALASVQGAATSDD